MAASLHAPWFAVFVESASLSDAERARAEEHLALAERLGATVARLRGANAADAILGFARRRRVTQIVLGKPTHPRWMDLVAGSFFDELVRKSGDIDVHAIQCDAEVRAA
jgi:two-component system sensor histidine kinase KdpD